MVDYGKWKDIEVSDDEDDTHPNIDTPSLFRWRHQARIERMTEQEEAKKAFESQKEAHAAKKVEIEQKKAKGEDVTQMQKEWDRIDKEIADTQEEIAKQERLTKWNVDTIGQEGFSKTMINTKTPEAKKVLTEEERAQKLQDFTRANESLMKQFGLLKKYVDSRKFLLEHTHLACEETTNYLTIWCVNLALEDKTELMNHVSHQCIAMQFMLELAKQLDRDPRSCISDFFSKIAHVEQTEYKKAFDDELSSFRDRVRRRAEEKIREAMEEERQSRLGPGGLDPYEVFDALPDELKACFESQNIPLLQETISKMPEQEAAYHMKRCIDSGLWVPDSKKKAEGADADAEGDVLPEVSEDEKGTKGIVEGAKAVSLEDN